MQGLRLRVVFENTKLRFSTRKQYIGGKKQIAKIYIVTQT